MWIIKTITFAIMWIIKSITFAICLTLCLIGTIAFVVPAILTWDINSTNSYYEGVWGVYEKMFKTKIPG